MKKSSFVLSSFALLLVAACNISWANEDYWCNFTGDNRWTNPNNWDYYNSTTGTWSYKVPGLPLDDALMIQPSYSGRSGPVFGAADGSQTPYFVVVGYEGYNGQLTMNGGTISAPWGFTFNKYGGTTSNSKMNMSGGLLYLGPWAGYVGDSSGFLGIGRAGTATFNMTGGTIECVSFVIPESGTGTTGTFNLNGGLVNAGSLTISSGGSSGIGKLNISQGKLIISGDATATVNGYVVSGLISAYPGYAGRRVVNVDYDNLNSGQTTVTASLTTLTQAWNPQPADTNMKVNQFAVLSWSLGDGAVSHTLYLGINFNDVSNGVVEPVSTDVNNYNPNGLIPGQTYYWRVDEFDGSTTYKGIVWSFTVAYNPLATNPLPGDGVEGVDPNANLTWTPGNGAVAHDVYLGTSSSDVAGASNPNVLPGRGRQTATTYDPGTLVLGQTYYWRIDEFDGSNVHKGTVWSFEVVSSLASNPSPSDGAQYIGTDVTLQWSAGYAALSCDVYLGTSFSDVNNGTAPTASTQASSYTPGGLQLGQTYYWRIDEFDGVNKYKGVVWSFATEPIGSVRAFPGAEGYGAYSKGGRGGDVYHVTTLADYNDWKGATETPIPGSLRYGLRTATGPRTIVFDISGYIDLKARLEFGNHYITIAGQTAPGDGITIRHWDLRLYQADNAIIRFIRVRPGYYADQVPVINRLGTDPNHINGGLDALSCEYTTNTIIDHCSLSWSADEVASITSDSNNITYQWNFITEPLNWNGHAYCSLLRPAMTSRLTHHHNLYGNCIQRLTRFGNYNDNVTTRFDWVNNIAFNWGPSDDDYGCTYSANNFYNWDYVIREGGTTTGTDGEFPYINLMNNYFIAGQNNYQDEFNGGNNPNTKIWVEGNYWNGSDSGWTRIAGSYYEMTSRFPVASPLTIDDATVAYNRVLANAGNWLVRDAVDTRLINQVVTGTGAIINYPSDVGGFPALNSVSRPAGFDTDGDGMPDKWEIARGLDPNNPSDGNSLAADGSGYTNVEEYLNYLAVRKTVLPADLNGDGQVDYDDLEIFAGEWLTNDCNNVPYADMNNDCGVDFKDFSIFAASWLKVYGK